MTEYSANELRRIIAMIPQTDPTTTEYHILLQSLECFAGIMESIEEIMEQVGEPDAEDGAIVKVEFRPEAALAVKPESIFHPEPESPFPEPEDKAEEEKPKAEPTEPARVWEMAEVRAALVEARRSKGINITELLKEFGVENFSAFPAGRYDELMKRLEG